MSKNNTLPKEIPQHFLPMGVNIVKVWWPRHVDSVFGMVPYFDGLYRVFKMRFSVPDGDADFYDYELRIYHQRPLRLGLALAKFPSKLKTFLSRPVRKSLFARKIRLWTEELRCWATQKERAEMLLQQPKIQEALVELLGIIKEYGNPFFVIDDRKISLKLDDRLPEQELLNSMCRISALLVEGLLPHDQKPAEALTEGNAISV